MEKSLKPNFSPFTNEFEVMTKMQNDFDARLQNMKPLDLIAIAEIFDDLEVHMNEIDQQREKQIFNQRLRDEWEDAFIKRYLQKGGEVGASLLPQEQKMAKVYKEQFIYRYERMRLQFLANKRNNEEFDQFKTLEEYMRTLGEKYQGNILLFVSNQKQARMPLSVTIKFQSYQEIKYIHTSDQRVKKRNNAQFQQAKDLMIDQLKQLEQVMTDEELEYLKVEGNLCGEDLLKRKLIDEAPYQIISKCFKKNSIIRILDLSNISIKEKAKTSMFASEKMVIGKNSAAIIDILESINASQVSLSHLGVLSLNNVDIDDKIMHQVCMIIQSNFIHELLMNNCALGSNILLIQKLSNSLSFNTSLRGIELNKNGLSDEQGCLILSSLLQQVNLPEREHPMLLNKLCLEGNSLSDESSVVLNKIFMKSQMRMIDISNNQIVLRFMDNIIVTSGYKSNLEFFGIEENKKTYLSRKAVCSCIGVSSKDSVAVTKVSELQLQNRNLRVIKQLDIQKFITAKVNIRKQRFSEHIYKFGDQQKENLEQQYLQVQYGGEHANPIIVLDQKQIEDPQSQQLKYEYELDISSQSQKINQC